MGTEHDALDGAVRIDLPGLQAARSALREGADLIDAHVGSFGELKAVLRALDAILDDDWRPSGPPARST